MGSSVSTGRDNDELVDNLIHAEYIQSPIVEKVFRAVDRADYFSVNARCGAYKDVAWKYGNLHLSAPCVYSKVMEGLELREGLSFLNIGSGTGYLSTMVGLILGTFGINHGIEIHKDVIDFANKKLDDFKNNSSALDEHDFTEPKFIHGNGVCIANETGLYDRVYCGARCPNYVVDYMKRLIKVGGILVIPIDDVLSQYKRTEEETWVETTLLSVSFTPLIMPQSAEEYSVHTIDKIVSEPLNLQAACRAVIRTILRKNIEIENPDIKLFTARKSIKRPRENREQLDIFSMFEINDHLTENPIRSKRRRSFLNRIYNLVEIAAPSDNKSTEDNNSEHDSNTEEEKITATVNGPATSSSSSSEDSSDYDSDELENTFINNFVHVNKIKRPLKMDSTDSGEETEELQKTRKQSEYADRIKRKKCLFKPDSSSDITHTDTSDSEVEEEEPKARYVSPYKDLMFKKIQALPLPHTLKIYMNFYRSVF